MMSFLMPNKADGSPTNATPPAGYIKLYDVRGSISKKLVHNGCEVGLHQTDAWYADPANTPNAYHDGTNYTDRYFSDMQAHPNGRYGLYEKSEKDTIGGSEQCIVVEEGQYPIDLAPTPTQYQQGLRYWTVCDSFADPLVPAEVTAGTGIGPNREWADNREGGILLVEDA